MIRIPNAVASKFGRQILTLQKHSPTILFVGGVVGTIGSTVLACRATLKLDEVLTETQRKMSEVQELKESAHEDYTPEDAKRDRAVLMVRGGMDIAKLYAPAVAIGTLSICALTKSHVILTTRNAGLAAAYASVEKAFDEYRKRVEGEVGADREREIYRGVGEAETKDETGKPKKEKLAGVNGYSQYARFFDEHSPRWSKDPDYNFALLRAQQNWANDRLQSRGHLFLNEVYDDLGIPRSKAGSVVGWILSKDGDNFVDFGIFNGDSEKVREFVNGQERSILLDFNVDGVIFDKID